MSDYSRRAFLAAATACGLRAADSAKSRYATPFKYGKLVLSASPDKAAFDSRSVDCPFVFQNDGLFYMTYIGWDGTDTRQGWRPVRTLLSGANSGRFCGGTRTRR